MKQLIFSARRYLTEESWCPHFSAAGVYISIDADLIPYGISLPCVGIKDGAVEYEHETTEGTVEAMEVDYIVCYEAAPGDEAHEGGHEALADGILGLTANLRDALRDNDLGIADIETALPLRETDAHIWMSDDLLCMRKILTMQYTRYRPTA